VYVRTPLLGYDMAWRFFAPDWRRQLELFLREQHTLRLAVHIASQSLSRELSNWLDCGRVSDRAARRILAYVLRAATRTTPFGLFAAVARVDMGTPAPLKIHSEMRTRTRPDMGWLSAFVDELKRDPDFRRMLRVCVNDSLLKRGSRYTAYHPSLVHRSDRPGTPLTYTSVSFNETQAVAFLKETVTAPERIIDIASRLEERFGEKYDDCINLLDQLWEGGFFIDELQLDPSGDPVTFMLDVLARTYEKRAQEMRKYLCQDKS
jgi:hypothetical protein